MELLPRLEYQGNRSGLYLSNSRGEYVWVNTRNILIGVGPGIKHKVSGAGGNISLCAAVYLAQRRREKNRHVKLATKNTISRTKGILIYRVFLCSLWINFLSWRHCVLARDKLFLSQRFTRLWRAQRTQRTQIFSTQGKKYPEL